MLTLHYGPVMHLLWAPLRCVIFRDARLQVLPVYVSTLLLSANAATGGFGGSVGLLVATGVLTLGLVSISLLL